jgi:hypothetical protein
MLASLFLLGSCIPIEPVPELVEAACLSRDGIIFDELGLKKLLNELIDAPSRVLR